MSLGSSGSATLSESDRPLANARANGCCRLIAAVPGPSTLGGASESPEWLASLPASLLLESTEILVSSSLWKVEVDRHAT